MRLCGEHMILLRETPERNYWLLEPGEAPIIEPGCIVALDVETTSRNPKLEALYAYHDYTALAGFAFTMDGMNAFYVPMRHRDCQWNWPIRNALQLIIDLFRAASEWCNHNMKFDAHFIAEELRREGMEQSKWLFTGRWYDTSVMARILNSDLLTYGLKELARTMLGVQTTSQDVIGSWLKDAKTKDYGDVPADITGEYACDDVFYVMDLRAKFEEEMPAQCRGIQDTECKLTPVLWDMEREGMLVDYEALQLEHASCLRSTILAADEIEKLTGSEFTNSPKSLFDIICVQLGLPVLERTKIGNPSFDSDALELYHGHPQVVCDPKASKVLDLIAAYREDATFMSLFLEGFKKFISSSQRRLHPDYNQIVRTGRLSCRRPNAQQQNKRSKALILPDPGMAFLSADASQIEFRLIVDYTEDAPSIAAYNENRRTDFHTWMSKVCEIERSPAKNMNFAQSFGAGKKRALAMLIADKSIVAAMGAKVDDLIQRGLLNPDERMKRFMALVQERAEHVYNTYHAKFPNLKIVARGAAATCVARGYVFNRFGRRRYLPPTLAHKSFNSIIQGCAADFVKSRIVATAPRYNDELRAAGISLRINVHDENVYHGEYDALVHYEPRINELLEQSGPVKFRVPIVWNSGVSKNNWAEAVIAAEEKSKK